MKKCVQEIGGKSLSTKAEAYNDLWCMCGSSSVIMAYSSFDTFFPASRRDSQSFLLRFSISEVIGLCPGNTLKLVFSKFAFTYSPYILTI